MSRGTIPRREFVKTAIAIGGSSALAACAGREGSGDPSTTAEASFPRGPDDPDTLPERQFAWGEYVPYDPHGNTIPPQHQVLLLLRYTGDGTPTDAERSAVETALTTLERAFQRGTGGDVSAVGNRGLLFMLGYTRPYFDRFDATLPDGVDLPSGADVMERLGEDGTSRASDHDALLLMTSDYGSILLGAEEALFGDADRMNGLAVESDLTDVFEVADRRTGVVGRGLPADRLDSEDVPEHAPLAMGFKSNFKDGFPPEDKMTIPDGWVADGTTGQLSRLGMDLEDWYDHPHGEQIQTMFSPHHDPESVGRSGERLGADSGVTEEMAENLDETAREHGCLGHSQKTARSRDDDFDPVILRRTEGVATDDDAPVFNFFAIQRRVEDFVETRKAMDPPDVDADVPPDMDGIHDYLTTMDRTTLLVPPRSHRAFPTPRGVPE